MNARARPVILVVDDESSNLQLLRQILQNDYALLFAKDGARALELARQERPALILLDVMMPGMSGHDTCRQLKAAPLTAAIPVIFVTALNQPEDETRALEAGAVDFISKPFNAAVVRARVRSQLTIKRQADAMRELSLTDSLTGVANRRHFYDIAIGKLLQARHSRNHYALLLVDMDRFKHVNERLGQLAGDALLQEAAARLRRVLRDGDVLARFGGDAFVLLLCEVASEERLAAVAGTILDALRQPFAPAAGAAILATASIGIALYPRDGQSVDALLSGADSAMAGAKTARDSFRFYDMALNLSSARSLELQGRFEMAMRENEFCLHYQGKFDTARGHIVGLEALLRWDHPHHGLIFPNEFIGLAEETAAILALGNWSIAAACRQLAQWRQDGLPLVPVAINISARQLRDPQLLATVTRCLAAHALAPALLELEVTESCFIDDISQAREVLERLRALGLVISLDDYGTGYSGLSHIRLLPIHTLKIDRSFIRDIAIDRNDAMIVASTIGLAHGLGLRVVAEGVESGDGRCAPGTGAGHVRPLCNRMHT
ncbi:MAG: EAL domain-containing protein [Janthinobacterium sp.]